MAISELFRICEQWAVVCGDPVSPVDTVPDDAVFHS